MNKFLPIGSVVILKNSNKQIMISGYLVAKNNNPEKIYDYSGFLYPLGLVSDKVFLFNKNDIFSIIFMGYQSKNFFDFRSKIEEQKLIKDGNKSNKINNIEILYES